MTSLCLLSTGQCLVRRLMIGAAFGELDSLSLLQLPNDSIENRPAFSLFLYLLSGYLIVGV